MNLRSELGTELCEVVWKLPMLQVSAFHDEKIQKMFAALGTLVPWISTPPLHMILLCYLLWGGGEFSFASSQVAITCAWEASMSYYFPIAGDS